MGKVTVNWTAEAERWLEEICEYIRHDDKPDAAQALDGHLKIELDFHGDAA